MKYLIRSIPLMISAVIAVIGVSSAAQNAPSPLPESAVDLRTSGAKDWSQTRLSAEPALREQIGRTMAYLDENASDVDGEISRLKTDGLLDRRTTSKIRVALDHARGSMTRVTEGMEANEPINGWTARMISYELGMAADTLTQQADAIKAELNASFESGDGTPAGDSSDTRQQRHLAKILTESGSLLKETARAIVHSLK